MEMRNLPQSTQIPLNISNYSNEIGDNFFNAAAAQLRDLQRSIDPNAEVMLEARLKALVEGMTRFLQTTDYLPRKVSQICQNDIPNQTAHPPQPP